MVSQKAKSKSNVESLAGLPGVGPVALKHLNDAGYFTMLQIKAGLRISDFVAITGMDRAKALEAYKVIDRELWNAKLLPEMEITGTQALKERQAVKRLCTGCKAFDSLFWHKYNPKDGMEYGAMTEIYGEKGVGKTQISHVLAFNYLVENPKNLVAWIDTESTFRPERMLNFADARKFTEKQKTEILDRVILVKVRNADMQLIALDNINSAISAETPIGMIIVDSVTAHFRAEFLERGMTGVKKNLFNRMLHKLKDIIEVHDMPCVIVNQVYESVDPQFGKDKFIPYGGNIIAHTSTYRIKLNMIGEGKNKRMAVMKKSALVDQNEALYQITEEGISDVKS